MKNVLPLMTDSYKFSHYPQYPSGTTEVFSYLESRGGKYSHTLFFGLQYMLKKYLSTPVTMEDVEYAKKRVEAHGMPFNYDGWKYIVEEHGGKLPLHIRAVPEGAIIPNKNVLMTMVNTDPKCFWLTNYMETLLMKVWYPITVATTSHTIKSIIKTFLQETADNTEGLPFKLHDFGYRGVSSEESAAIGGAAHLVNFMGTDTFAGLEMLTEYYGADIAGHSIPASEHSTITSWGRLNEFQAFANMVDKYKDNPLIACVSDSYDIYEAIKMWGKLKGKLKANGQTIVVRPDSGDPLEMSVQCIELLDKEFGSSYNTKGYKVLEGARVIYGDGISSPDVVREILNALKQKGYSADNIAFGMGGGLLQKCDRDTQKFAIKCSAATINGRYTPVFKDPITDPGKVSKKGFLDLVRDIKGNFETVSSEMSTGTPGSCLTDYYVDGEIKCNQSLQSIRKRVEEFEDGKYSY
jgi:nicotinamide phosphoribosyltransferase